MKKKFNTTGNCYVKKHYMMDNSAKIAKVYKLVENGEYFSINRPRQYGKTTTLFAIEEKLQQSEDYFPIRLNFQGLDQKYQELDSAFAQMFVKELANYFEFLSTEFYDFVKKYEAEVLDMNQLSRFITKLVHFSPRKLVLLIDEVDASSNYMPFLTFLGMLRTKYLDRESKHNYTFHSVVLVGVHDVKSLKYKIRNLEETQYNSPWNIAIDFKAAMEFSPEEIAPMLREYSEAENVQMNVEQIAERLYFHTAGYPFLVSRLCQIVVEDILPQKENQKWDLEDIEKAIQSIQNEVNTNFESLIKNLENHEDLYELVYDILIEGDIVPFNPHNSPIHKGVIYGVFKQNGVVKIHNRIYEQVIYNYLISDKRSKMGKMVLENQFVIEQNQLNFPFILQRFQVHMKEHYSTKDLPFLEREWRLIFMAFLKPIINGKGHSFLEVVISEEKRLDAVISFGQNKYVVELKIWRGNEYHERGLVQLADYLEKQGLETGFLVIFDQRRQTVWQEEWIDLEGKRIFAVWV